MKKQVEELTCQYCKIKHFYEVNEHTKYEFECAACYLKNKVSPIVVAWKSGPEDYYVRHPIYWYRESKNETT